MVPTKRRTHVRDDARRLLWERSQGRCETCGAELRRRIPVPREKVLTIRLWDGFPCYRCGHLNKAIDLTDDLQQRVMWLTRDDIGAALSGKFPFFRKGLSKTAGGSYYANHCRNCGSLQGDWFLMEWLLDQECQTIPTLTEVFRYEGELLDAEEVTGYDNIPHDVHHRDGNPINDTVENLQLLCRTCHRRLSQQLRDKKDKTSSWEQR